MGALAHLLANKWLLYRSEVLKRRQKHMCVLWATNVFDKLAQFLAQCSEYLILILNGLYGYC